jgi:hypothetical protein
MNSTALKHDACIPYLGLYLTDLMMVDIAHPSSGGIDSDHRQFKMNNILRLVSELQQSRYEQLAVISTIQEYLSDVRYIDELQKFLEDDQFKLSERLEPNSPQVSSTSSKESVRSGRPAAHGLPVGHPDLLQELNLSPAKRSNAKGSGPASKFVPGHRKSKSEGGNIFFACAGSGLASPEVTCQIFIPDTNPWLAGAGPDQRAGQGPRPGPGGQLRLPGEGEGDPLLAAGRQPAGGQLALRHRVPAAGRPRPAAR